MRYGCPSGPRAKSVSTFWRSRRYTSSGRRFSHCRAPSSRCRVPYRGGKLATDGADGTRFSALRSRRADGRGRYHHGGRLLRGPRPRRARTTPGASHRSRPRTDRSVNLSKERIDRPVQTSRSLGSARFTPDTSAWATRAGTGSPVVQLRTSTDRSTTPHSSNWSTSNTLLLRPSSERAIWMQVDRHVSASAAS